MRDEIRENYEAEVRCIERILEFLRYYDFTEYEIAKIAHKARRNIGIKYKNKRTDEYRAEIYKRNIEKYGDKYGPSFEFLLDQGKTCKEIIESSLRYNQNYSKLREKFLNNLKVD